MEITIDYTDLKNLLHAATGNIKDFVTNEDGFVLDYLNELDSCKKLCECGGSERIALDCTMKPCRHPKYNVKNGN